MPKKRAVPAGVTLNGKTYKCYFEYDTYGEVRAIHGGEPDYLDPSILADFVVAGLKKQHPEITRDVIMSAKPQVPMIPAVLSVKDAIQELFYGPDFKFEEEDDKEKDKDEKVNPKDDKPSK